MIRLKEVLGDVVKTGWFRVTFAVAILFILFILLFNMLGQDRPEGTITAEAVHEPDTASAGKTAAPSIGSLLIWLSLLFVGLIATFRLVEFSGKGR